MSEPTTFLFTQHKDNSLFSTSSISYSNGRMPFQKSTVSWNICVFELSVDVSWLITTVSRCVRPCISWRISFLDQSWGYFPSVSSHKYCISIISLSWGMTAQYLSVTNMLSAGSSLKRLAALYWLKAATDCQRNVIPHYETDHRDRIDQGSVDTIHPYFEWFVRSNLQASPADQRDSFSVLLFLHDSLLNKIDHDNHRRRWSHVDRSVVAWSWS